MEFVLISAGKFKMGSVISPEEAARRYGGKIRWYKDEHPEHIVKITKSFYLQKTEVTEGQWKKGYGV
jgi:formylglycine-generating enzyme required for sulfatase activity